MRIIDHWMLYFNEDDMKMKTQIKRCSREIFMNGFNFIKKQEFYVQNEIFFLSNVKISITSHFSYLYLPISYCLLNIMCCFYMLEVTHI